MKKIIKIAALILALICIGTSFASCGGKNSGGGLIPEPDKSQIIGVGARVYVFGEYSSQILANRGTDFTTDKTTNSTEEFLTTLKNLTGPNDPELIFKNATVMEGNYLKIDFGIVVGYSPYTLHISITLPEKIKKVTMTRRKDFTEKSEMLIENFGTISEDRKTFSFVGPYNNGTHCNETDDLTYGTLRIYY